MNWINVNEKLPETDKKVAYKMENEKIDIGAYDGKNFWTIDPISISEITHWMYLDDYNHEKGLKY